MPQTKRCLQPTKKQYPKYVNDSKASKKTYNTIGGWGEWTKEKNGQLTEENHQIYENLISNQGNRKCKPQYYFILV